MDSSRFIEEIAARFNEMGSRLSELAANSPARDIEKNFKAVLSGVFERFDLVSREEFEVQRDLLAKALEKVSELEARLIALETSRDGA